MKKIAFFLVLAFALLFPAVFAATVSHPASQVSPGAFQSGDYSFDGNVGVGISSSGYVFDVKGNVSLNDTLFVTEAGNVGIGTASPSTYLEVTMGSFISPAINIKGSTSESYSNRSSLGFNYIGPGINTGYIIGSGRTDDSQDFYLYDAYDGAYRVLVDTSGKVGIGTTSPSQTLEVNGNIQVYSQDSNTNLYLKNAGSNNDSLIRWLNSTGNTVFYMGHLSDDGDFVIENVISGETVFRSYSDGHITFDEGDIQFTSAGKILVQGGSQSVPGYSFIGDDDTGVYSSTSNTLRLSTGGSYVMHLDSTGVGIFMTTPSVALDVAGSIEYTGTITDVSDERLKTNITVINNSLSKLEQVRGITYSQIGMDERYMGVLAQDVQAVFPEAVSVIDPENGYFGVDYTQLVAPLIEATKELKKEKDEEMSSLNDYIEMHNQEIEELEVENSVLKAALCRHFPDDEACLG